MDTLCSFCHIPIIPTDIFCPKCGKKIERVSQELTTMEIVKIYSVSILLFPFGIYWFFKYFRSANPNKKKVAYITLAINLVVLGLLLIANYYLMAAMNTYLNSGYLTGY